MGSTSGAFAKFFLVLLLNVLVLNFVNYVVEGAQSISKEEDMELERQLKILNKAPIKTFLSPWGDTYDCIDIYKQPALDHPLLKDHKIQVKTNQELETDDRAETSIFRTQMERCPEGSVPIRRTSKQDLIRAKLLSSTVSVSNNAAQYFAGVVYQSENEKFYGATANMSVWKPNLNPDQFSAAEISVRSGWNDQSTRIHAGWMVNPILYGNTSVRHFLYWTADNGRHTGCFNTLCPGFVQVHPKVTPDMLIPNPSAYGSSLVDYQFRIHLNRAEHKWWYTYLGNIVIGYWPAEIFPLFGNTGAERIYWGGHSRASEDGHAPEMGSGHFPREYGIGKHGSYIVSMQYYNQAGSLLDPREKLMTKVLGCKRHYDMEYYGPIVKEVGHSLQYGGPGGKC